MLLLEHGSTGLDGRESLPSGLDGRYWPDRQALPGFGRDAKIMTMYQRIKSRYGNPGGARHEALRISQCALGARGEGLKACGVNSFSASTCSRTGYRQGIKEYANWRDSAAYVKASRGGWYIVKNYQRATAKLWKTSAAALAAIRVCRAPSCAGRNGVKRCNGASKVQLVDLRWRAPARDRGRGA